jgi:hypothetical protein
MKVKCEAIIYSTRIIMTTKRNVENMNKWLILKQAIIDKGYKLFTMQYRWSEPEGFIATFYKGDKDVEVITHNEVIEHDVVNSNLCGGNDNFESADDKNSCF